MADPLSIVTGLGGLITLSIEVAKLIREYAIGVRNGPANAEQYLQMLGALTEVLNQLQRFLKQEAAETASFNESSILLQTNELCKARLNEVHLQLRRHLSGPGLTRVLKWPFQEKEHRKNLQDLKQWTETFHFALTIDGCRLLSRTSREVELNLQYQLEETRKISLAVPSIRESAKKTASSLECMLDAISSFDNISMGINETIGCVGKMEKLASNIESRHSKDEYQRKRVEFLERLSSMNFRSKLIENIKNRSTCTGKWLFLETQYQAWLEADSPAVLWFTGAPGSGKTMLASTVIQQLKDHPAGSNVAYVFFDYKAKDQQTENAIVACLLRQILEQLADIPRYLLRALEEQFLRKRFSEIEVGQSVAMLESVCKQNTPAPSIISDALDKCSDGTRPKLLSLVHQVSKFAKVLITSRSHIDLSPDIQGCACLEIEAHEDDILLYLEDRKRSHPLFYQIVDTTPGLNREIESAIVKRAAGMFLLARLQMDSLIEQTSARDIRKSLEQLPKTVSETFDSVMDRIYTQPLPYAALAHDAISWVLYARRPLKTNEFCQALAVEPEDSAFDRSGTYGEDLLVKICCGLIYIDQRTKVIRLLHLSLEEHLVEFWRTHFPGTEKRIAVACLAFLNLEDFSIPCENDAQVREREESFPFLKYASQEWSHHTCNSFEDDLKGPMYRYLYDKNHLLSVLQVKKHIYPTSGGRWKRNPDYEIGGSANLDEIKTFPIHLAIKYGLEHVVCQLLELGADIKMTDTEERMLQIVSAKSTLYKSVNCLLQQKLEFAA